MRDDEQQQQKTIDDIADWKQLIKKEELSADISNIVDTGTGACVLPCSMMLESDAAIYK